MATTTINIDAKDSRDQAQVSAGGSAGSRGLQIIIDHSKFTGPNEISLALQRAAELVDDKHPLPSA